MFKPIMIALGLLAAFTWAALSERTVSDFTEAEWRLQTDPPANLRGGSVAVKPKDQGWASALLAGRKALPLWNEEGVTVRLRGRFAASAQGEPDDAVVFVGFTPDASLKRLQSTPNQVGLSLRFSRKKQAVEAALAVKEAAGEEMKRRGDSQGNFVYYKYPATSVPVRDGEVALDLTLHVDEKYLSIRWEGNDFAQELPHGLTGKFWASGAVFVVQVLNTGGGRASLAVEQITVGEPALDLKKLVPLRLEAFANMGLADETEGDKVGGWTDQGKNNLGKLATGLRLLRGIPFFVIPPEKNGGKSALMLYSKNREYFPRKIGPIPLAASCDSLLFLHTAAWAKDGALAGTYRVRYNDQTTLDIPIRVGREIQDWWSLRELDAEQACLIARVPSDQSAKGEVGLYGFRWVNPSPGKPIAELELLTADGAPVLGLVAITRVDASVSMLEQKLLRQAFMPSVEEDTRRNPPDAALLSDQVALRAPKRLGPTAFSVAGYYNASKTGTLEHPQAWGELIKSMGGLVRFPYGLEISFNFWPAEAKDWYPVLTEKGGQYGVIQPWFYKWGDRSNMLTIPRMLETAKAQGLKLILQLNTHALFDGREFRYVKTLPEERMKRENPLEAGVFDDGNLAKVVEGNRQLVDFVVRGGYLDTIAYWEMDNERWDMKGDEYAKVVAAHLAMLREKLPAAKVIVCMGELDSWSPNPMASHYVAWTRDVLAGLKARGWAGKVDCFAPHLYPYLGDGTNQIQENHLMDFAVRNVNRSLDLLSTLMDQNGFEGSRFYVSEWGVQSDGVASARRNDLLSSMAAALATARCAMAIYAHPRVEGATFHHFIHDSRVSAAEKRGFSIWGAQSVYYFPETGKYLATPVLEALRLFIAFCKDSELVPEAAAVPKGVHVLAARDAQGKKYFVVNGTAQSCAFQKPVVSRTTLSAARPELGLVRKWGSYGAQAGDVEIVAPVSSQDGMLPAWSVNILRGQP